MDERAWHENFTVKGYQDVTPKRKSIAERRMEEWLEMAERVEHPDNVMGALRRAVRYGLDVAEAKGT